MKNRLILLLCAVLGLLGSTACAADIAGQWHAEFDTQIGPQKYLFTFQVNEGILTAKATAEARGEKRQVEFKEAKLEGDTLTFVEMRKSQDNEVRIEYSGKVIGQEIEFTRKVSDLGIKENQVPHVWHVDGNGHDATHWRNNLWLFSQRIFK